MIQIKYKRLFDVEFLHNFYQSGKSDDLLLVPTAACSNLIKYLGLRFLPTAFGGALFAKVNTVGGKDLIKNPIPDGTKFTFLVKLKRKVFENFTELNLKKPRASHYYFSNLSNNISASGFPLLVANTASKTASDTDLLPFVTNSFSYTHNAAAAAQNSELRFIDSGESFQQLLQNNRDTFNFTYDLNKASGGRMKFFIEGTEQSFVYAIDAADSREVFAVAEIFYRNTLPAAYQFQQPDNAIETKFYKIAFSNRSVKWRYVITRKFNQSVTGITIAKTNGGVIGFTEITGSPPTDQFIVVSDNPLPFKEEPVGGIKLSDQASKVIVASLPNPSLAMIRVEETAIFSDILITI